MKESYRVVGRNDREKIREFLGGEGRELLPLVEMLDASQMALDTVLQEAGRRIIEMLLRASAESVAGPKHQGKAVGEFYWHGTQPGTVPLADRRMRVSRPRIRRKGGAEESVPLYESLNSRPSLGERMLEILMLGISTRKYADTLPRMAEAVGISKSEVSREFIEESAEKLRALQERRFDELDLMVIFVDGIRFGAHHVIVALGVDTKGCKHVLGLGDGATENSVVVKDLLANLGERGLKPEQRRLFVIDGSKALRKAIDEVFGANNPVQRCRVHKVRNVQEYLPKDMRGPVGTAMKAAFKLEAKAGKAKLKKLAEWLKQEYPSAAASLTEGLDEMFTVSELGVTGKLCRSLSSTNLIENPNSGIRRRTYRVSRWKDGQMVLRWVATALMDVEKRFRRIMGYQDLDTLKAALDSKDEDGKSLDEKRKVA